MFVLCLVKVIDNIILTAKSIATYQNRKLLSSILVVISQLLFYIVIKQVVADDSLITIAIVSVGSGIGTYIAFLINDKYKKDSKWMYILCSSDIEDIKKLCSYLVANDIKYQANHGLTRKGKETINVIAFSKTKTESRLIEKFLQETDSKYLKEIMK